MQFFNYSLLLLCGFAAGFITAAAYVAFVAMLGIFPKVAAKTKTADECILYENCLMLGILLSVLVQFFLSYESAGMIAPAAMQNFLGILFLCLIGLFGGIYIGFLIGGLSEVLNVIPIYAKKAHIKRRAGLVIICFALGKGLFMLIQFLILDA